MSPNSTCIAALLSRHWLTRLLSKTRIAGALIRPGGRNAGNWWRNGSGTCAWNWGISFSLIRSARPNLLLPSHLPPSLPLSLAMLPHTWACPGKQLAFRARTLLFSLMGPCGARLRRNSSHMNTAEKPMGACVSCMEPAFAIVAPAHCASSVNGTAALPKSHARSACCCILSRWAPHRYFGGTGVAENTGAPVCSSCDTNTSR
jgi:hypothetical protein